MSKSSSQPPADQFVKSPGSPGYFWLQLAKTITSFVNTRVQKLVRPHYFT
jgi:hypothetical protein